MRSVKCEECEGTSSRALVVEEHTVAREDIVSLPIVDYNPVGVQFSSSIR